MSSIRRGLPVHIVLLAAGLLSLFPLYWLFLTSLSPAQYVVKVPPEIVPRELTLSNYQRLFETTPIIRWLVNTVVIAGVITAFHLLFNNITNYAFAKRQRDLAKKQKNEAKRQRKLEPAEAPAVGTGPSPVSENTISGSDATGEKS